MSQVSKPKVRRGYLILLGLGFFLLLANEAQTWWYLHWTPPVPALVERTQGSTLTCSVLVAGAGLDLAEEATGLRDLAAAQEAILKAYEGRHKIRTLHPGQDGYSPQAFLDAMAEVEKCERLIVYLTGHGGGKNFGANSRFNLTREAIMQAVSEVPCGESVIVVDCCFSGAVSVGLESVSLERPLTLITSTDDRHPAPFPVSFLSPRSYGRMWFDRLHRGEREAFEDTNARRRWLRSFYPQEIGLQGTWTEVGGSQ